MAALIAAVAFAATLALGLAARSLATRSALGGLLRGAAGWATPERDAARRQLSLDLVRAGLGDRALLAYLASRALLTVALPALALALVRPAGLVHALGLAWVAAGLGYLAPSLGVRALRARRQAALRAAAPAMVDLLIPCLEAGLSLEAGLERVAREVGPLAPALAAELERLLGEIRAGVPRREALLELPLRTGVDELRALVDAVLRAELGGVGVVRSLRALAQELRTMQVLDAERRAAATGPALTVAMIVFLLPLFVVVIVGPTVAQVSRVVFGP